MSRGLRVLYVENDEALLGLLGQSISLHPKIEQLVAARNSDEALKFAESTRFDGALLDVSLGPTSLTGVELALELRAKNEHLGIVLLSQHISAGYLSSLPDQFGYGWSAIQKSATLSFNYLVDVLELTAKGKTVADPNTLIGVEETTNHSAKLTKRQHQVIALAATGLDATEIAKHLNLAAVSVRQELSKCYKVLIPNPKPGTDLRTAAVLKYLRDTRAGLD